MPEIKAFGGFFVIGITFINDSSHQIRVSKSHCLIDKRQFDIWHTVTGFSFHKRHTEAIENRNTNSLFLLSK